MKKCIIITTIHPPSQALIRFAETDFDLIVVGDEKTPSHYSGLNGTFLDLTAQDKLFPTFSRLLPKNSYARKNLGYAYALEQGYDLIAESDDDNKPLPHWGEVPTDFSRTVVAPEYPNIYSLYTAEHIWPRGFPLDKLSNNQTIRIEEQKDNRIFAVQGLAHGEPDVDALFRLTAKNAATSITFRNQGHYALDVGVLSPFNSQNTLWLHKAAFLYLYLPITVTFRYTDILRAYVAQYGFWVHGGKLGITGPSVHQDRNEHNLMNDFYDEIPMYRDFYRVMQVLKDASLNKGNTDLHHIYDALCQQGLVAAVELPVVEEWMRIVDSYL